MLIFHSHLFLNKLLEIVQETKRSVSPNIKINLSLVIIVCCFYGHCKLSAKVIKFSNNVQPHMHLSRMQATTLADSASFTNFVAWEKTN